ncbi:MAG TPA: DUF5995 family protein [Gaiellaceae bacterium]
MIARMEAIDASLPAADGVAWFNKLYLAVTRAVHGDLAEATFADPRFLARLDVVFANLYLRALDAAKEPPRAWAPLFACRRRKRIAPIQFALAGMNAHINYDLPVALVQTCRDLGVDLLRARRQHRDYLAVNGLLERTEAKVKRWFSTGFVGVVDVSLGDIDDRVAMWNVTRARDAAWVNAQTLWALRDATAIRKRYLATLDRTVGFAGRGLLLPLE